MAGDCAFKLHLVSTPPQRTVVQETRYIAPARQRVITTLPPNYRVRVYAGKPITYTIMSTIALTRAGMWW